ncbi:MAG TPA: acetyl-CoA carboxylase biotin carboxylase subunit [Chloroflexota bacterium]
MFKKVLVANRGEIAVRIIRTLRELGIRSIAAFSDADRNALFVELADEAYFLGAGPSTASYLNIQALLEVASLSGADAVHPGYGFLAENAEFAQAVADARMIFIGPSVDSIRLMGNKVAAKQAASRLGVPLVPGTQEPVRSLADVENFVRQHGFPVAVKASAGGGGRGIRVVRDPNALADALERSSREAQTYFRDPAVYVERYFEHPRHVEIQVLGDQHGNLIHLGERECSLQRMHQKLIEEAPSTAVSSALRAQMGEMALRAASAAQYWSAGTVEFLLDQSGAFYFLEMNTRIQVEHPVTEMVTGTDLIKEMVLVAAGEAMTTSGSRSDLDGHAIEVRINAEDPQNGFRPSTTSITDYLAPGGPGVRVDSGVRAGSVIPQYYDSLLSKLIVWAHDREAARLRMLRAMDEYRIDGPVTTLPFAQSLLTSEEFITSRFSTTFVEDELSRLVAHLQPVVTSGSAQSPGVVRVGGREFEVEVNRKFFRVHVSEVEKAPSVASATSRAVRPDVSKGRGATLASPMHGTVLSVSAAQGQTVEAGQTVIVIEAMKMENDVHVHRSGRIKEVHVRPGDTVETGQPLLTLE